jgi:class 3 adenylate cyclase
VLDAVGARPAVVLGVSAGATTALLLASRHPERVKALVLFGGFARTIAGPDYDIGFDHAVVESFARNLEGGWGTGVAISSFAPSRARDEGVRGYWARYQQLSASPTSAMRFFWAAIHSDVRDVLTTIAVPTLVVHAERDVIVPIEQARYMADRIPGAEFVPLDSDVHLICLSDAIDQLTREVQAFVARKVFDRQVAAVLVTALAIHTTSSRHRMDIEGVLERCGGRLQGPPLTATFDGPGAAIRCARGVVSELAAAGVHVGVGLHCGECVPTDVGYRGVAVDVARQLATEAAAGEILLTRTVRDLVLDGDIDVHRRGVLSRPGWPKDSPVYALVPEPGRAEPPVRVADRTVGR